MMRTFSPSLSLRVETQPLGCKADWFAFAGKSCINSRALSPGSDSRTLQAVRPSIRPCWRPGLRSGVPLRLLPKLAIPHSPGTVLEACGLRGQQETERGAQHRCPDQSSCTRFAH